MSTTPTPTDPPPPRDRHARRRAHNALHFPRMAELWQEHRTHAEIAKALEAEGRRDWMDDPYTANGVRAVLKDGMDKDKYKALAKVGMGRANRARRLEAELLSPRLEELRRKRLTYAEIAKVLNDEGIESPRGGPWNADMVWYALRDRMGEDERVALRKAGQSRGARIVAARREAWEREIVDRAAALWKSLGSLKRVALELNARGVTNSQDGRWTAQLLSALLKRRMDPAEHAALVTAGHRAGGATKTLRTRRHDDLIRPRILELRDQGLTQRQIALRLNEEAGDDDTRLNSCGEPWTQKTIGAVLSRAAPGHPPVILGETALRVLGVDGRYREKSLGSGARREARHKLAATMLLPRNAAYGLSNDAVQNVTPGGRSIIRTWRKDRIMAQVLYPPDKALGLGWRFGPPRPSSAGVSGRPDPSTDNCKTHAAGDET